MIISFLLDVFLNYTTLMFSFHKPEIFLIQSMVLFHYHVACNKYIELYGMYQSIHPLIVSLGKVFHTP